MVRIRTAVAQVKWGKGADGLLVARGKVSFSELFLLSQKFLRFESGHATAASACDGLPVSLVLNITSSENTFNRSLSRPWNSDDITIGICLNL